MPVFTTLVAVGGAYYAYLLMNEPLDTDEDEAELAAQATEHRFQLAAASVALALGGKLLTPLLGPLSLAPSLYVTLPLWGEAYRAVTVERKVRASVVDVLAISIAVATDSYFALALGAFFHTFSRKLLGQTEDRSRRKAGALSGRRCGCSFTTSCPRRSRARS